MRSVIYIFSFIFLFSGTAFAASLDDVRAAINTGQYDHAYEQGSALGSAEGLLLAAESLNTKIMLGQSKSAKKDAQRAMKLAQGILAQNPDHKGASLQYAIAYGFYGREVSAVTAWRKNLPTKIQIAIQAARDNNEYIPQTDALLGAWHFSVVYKAGAKRARKSYGATQIKGGSFFEAALASAPDDIIIRANYSMMLYVLNPKDNLPIVQHLLGGFKNAKPSNDLEFQVLSTVQKFDAALGEPKAATKIAKNFLNW